MKRLSAHPLLLALIALALAGIAVGAIAAAYGFGAFAHAWSHLRYGWLVGAGVAVLLTIPAYALAYRDVLGSGGGLRVPAARVATLVIAGFGPVVPGGGFALDRRALNAVQDDQREATRRVLGLGALEWALLAPAAWVVALVLLIEGDSRVLGSVLWPWVILVPVGFGLVLALARSRRAPRVSWLDNLLKTIDVLGRLAQGARDHWGAWVGMTLYWTLDIGALYAAARFVGLRLTVPELIIAYATGYALTRRSMPLAGAGATEVLLTFALHWVGEPVPASLAVVVVYRVFNLVMPTVAALAVHPQLEPLLDSP